MSQIIDEIPSQSFGHKRLIMSAVALLALGLLIGYLLFGRGATAPVADEHDHTLMESAAEAGIWTCSMHPQIQRSEPGDCPVCGMDLIPLETTASDNPLVMTMSAAAVAMSQIRTTAVSAAGSEDESAPETIVLNGRLTADERTSAVQTAHVPGRIERLYVTFEGERVKAGQQLALIYSPELVSAQRELLEALRFSEANPALLEASRAKLRNLRVSDQTIADIEAGGEPQTNLTIYADGAGVVISKLVEVGDYVTTGQPMFTLANLDKLWVELDAYESDLAAISLGDRISFTTSAVAGTAYSARVSFIDPLIDPETRTATIRAEVNNSRGLLKPQMFVRARLEAKSNAISQEGAPLLVPNTAVLWTGERSVVYVEVPDAQVPSYEFTEVTLGSRVGDAYQVNEGLRAGDRVVTNGAFAIDAAAQLNNQASMMNRDVVVEGATSGSEVGAIYPDYSATTPAAFKLQLERATQNYLLVKEALVAGDGSAAASASVGFGESLSTVDMTLLTGAAHDYWMERRAALTTHSDAIAAAVDIEEMRRQFVFLSEAMICTLSSFGAGEQTLYVQHCPMARDGLGADWVSAEEQVRNPYYGDAMLTCGSVTDVLKPTKN